MKNILNIFQNDAFSMASMCDAIQKVPTVPRQLGNMKIFTPMPIRTVDFGIEIDEKSLKLIPFSQRGEPLSQKETNRRKMITFNTFRVAKGDKLLASQLAFVRQFGSEDQMIQAVAEEIASRQTGPGGLMDDVDATKENMRLSALFGQLKDADGTVVEDYYAAFGVQQPADLMLALATTSDGNLRYNIEKNVVIPMRQKAKGARFTKVYAMCGTEAWLELCKNPEFYATYLAQLQGQELRDGTLDKTYSFAGCEWFPYFGTDDNETVALDEDEIVFFPGGVNNSVFREVLSPGETFDDIGQMGKDIYSRIILDDKRNTHVDLEVMSYPTYVNTRPEMIRKGRSGA